MTAKVIIPFALLIFNALSSFSQDYKPAPENLEAREWFQDAKFGMFIHWGIYSVLAGGGEEDVAVWVMEQKEIPVKDYETLADFFDPESFNAEEWVSLAKAAGMKYITMTIKHHDGFSMYDSKVSAYNIVNSTPYKKDVLRMLADECRKQDIKLFIYYSQLDWHHPDYYPWGGTGQSYTGRPEAGEWKDYISYQNDQLKELLTNYGEVAGIWFDGWWDRKDADWQLKETYALIHKLQPQALIGNNHHQPPFPGEDFQMFERDLPGENTAGFSGESKIGQLPLETCATMNGPWGFNLVDKNFKDKKTLLHYLIKAAGYNANFLLNNGPMPNGKMQPEVISLLKEMGLWLEDYGETIYGTRGGPIEPQKWGVSTKKGKKVYLHILEYPEDELIVDFGKTKIASAIFYDDKSAVKFSKSKDGIGFVLPGEKKQEVDTIIELTLK